VSKREWHVVLQKYSNPDFLHEIFETINVVIIKMLKTQIQEELSSQVDTNQSYTIFLFLASLKCARETWQE
jgi:hypothetical protein